MHGRHAPHALTFHGLYVHMCTLPSGGLDQKEFLSAEQIRVYWTHTAFEMYPPIQTQILGF
jgi:hypothetical protein